MMTRYNGIMENFEETEIRSESDVAVDVEGEGEETESLADRPTLREDSRTRARSRIIQGALIAMASSGLDATIDEVAQASGVSRRTVFRHFSSHGELMAASISQGLNVLGAHLPDPPSERSDVEQWLVTTVVTMHEVIRRLLGRAFWDIHIDRPGTPEEVVAAIDDIAIQRRRVAGELTAASWAAVGGHGEPPRVVIDAFAQQVSGFATYALPEKSAQETGTLSARMLWLVLQDARSTQRP